ncbi:MAG: succinate dehydrogenase, cytochrome b556 subunit [Pseudomonadota bacterium]
MSSSVSSSGRPLSPHLTIYKLIPTMIASIMHRITGVALYFGTLLVAIWLIAAATGPGTFDVVNAIYSSWFGLLVLFGYTWALMHHMLGGIRHFLWDVTILMDKATATKLAYATFIGSASLTLLIWIVVAIVR